MYKKFKKTKNDWSGVGIREKSKEGNLEWDYDFIYKLASSLEHSDIHSSKEYIKNVDDAQRLITFQGGPSSNYINESAITAVKYMGQHLELFLNTFELDNKYKIRLDKFGMRFAEFMKKDKS